VDRHGQTRHVAGLVDETNGHGICFFRCYVRVATLYLGETVVLVVELRIVTGGALALTVQTLAQVGSADVSGYGAAQTEIVIYLPVEASLPCPDAATAGVIRPAGSQVQVELLDAGNVGDERYQSLGEVFLHVVVAGVGLYGAEHPDRRVVGDRGRNAADAERGVVARSGLGGEVVRTDGLGDGVLAPGEAHGTADGTGAPAFPELAAGADVDKALTQVFDDQFVRAKHVVEAGLADVAGAEQVDRHAVCVVRVAHQGGVANDLASGRITDGVHGLVEAVGTRVVDQAYFVLVVAVLVVAVNHPAAKEAIIDFLFETNGDGLRGVGGRHARAGQVGGV